MNAAPILSPSLTMREAAVNLAAMNTPDAIPTGGPFIYRPTCGDVPYKQPVIQFMESRGEKQELRYFQWFNALPEREKDRRWIELYKSSKQQLDNEGSGSILGA